MDEKLELVKGLKIILSRYLRCNNKMDELLEDISASFDIFSIEMQENGEIYLRVKKTSIKKGCDLYLYYVTNICGVLLTFLRRNYDDIYRFCLPLAPWKNWEMAISRFKDMDIPAFLFNVFVLSENVAVIRL